MCQRRSLSILNILTSLWVEHSRFENISGPAILFGNEKNTRTEVNLVDIACHGVKVFAQLRESGKTFDGPADSYIVKSFCLRPQAEKRSGLGEH